VKEWTPTLKTHKAGGTLTLATCIRAERLDGFVLATTGHDTDLVVDGLTYQSSHAYSASDVVSGCNLAPDNLEIEGFLAAPSITADDIRTGLWDRARITMFEVDYTNPSGGKDFIREATLGELRAGTRLMFVAEVRGLLQALSRNIGDLLDPVCLNVLGDARCKVVMAPYTDAGAQVQTVASNFRRSNFTANLLQPIDWYTGGYVIFTEGANVGYRMEVQWYSGPPVSRLILQQPLPFDIEPGDIFTAVAGCAGAFTRDCVNKFSNGINYRGAPEDLPGVKIYRRGGVS
jgi:uncharacterized phage protein (TIGR02218 family)